MKTVYVEFKKNGKQYIFLDNDLELGSGVNVIVNTEKGNQFGKVVKYGDQIEDKEYAKIIRIATKKDIEQNKKNKDLAKSAIQKAQEMSKKLNLDMKFTDGYFTFDQSQLVLNFIADARVDFRELAKCLAGIYKTRIELRQIGVRDKAKEISGIGQCGRKLCCSCFLNDMDSVSIAMVKNQNLSLNPNKINGQCGRLLCCLKYENDLYIENRKVLPEMGEKVKDEDGFEGIVSFIDIPNKKYILKNDDGEQRIKILKNKCDRCEKRCSNK